MGKRKRVVPSSVKNPFSRNTQLKRGKHSTGLIALSKQLNVHQKQQTRKHREQKQQHEKQVKTAKQHAEQHARVPYTLCQRILLMGEGNFSFAHSLLKCRQTHETSTCHCNVKTSLSSSTSEQHHEHEHDGSNITATCYDSLERLQYKYHDAIEHMNALQHAGASIMTDIDARQLHKYPEFRIRIPVMKDRGGKRHRHRQEQDDGDNADDHENTEHSDEEYNNNDASDDDDAASGSHSIDQQIMRVKDRMKAMNNTVYHRQYDRLVWLFPHTGSGEKDTKKNNAQHQALIHDYLQSIVQSRIVKAGCRYDTSKTQQQQQASPLILDRNDARYLHNGGEIHIVTKIGKPYDDWDLKNVSKSVDGIRYAGCYPWYPSLYTQHGYGHRKTAGSYDDVSGTQQHGDDNDNEFFDRMNSFE
jgi:hypothetical protein